MLGIVGIVGNVGADCAEVEAWSSAGGGGGGAPAAVDVEVVSELPPPRLDRGSELGSLAATATVSSFDGAGAAGVSFFDSLSSSPLALVCVPSLASIGLNLLYNQVQGTC